MNISEELYQTVSALVPDREVEQGVYLSTLLLAAYDRTSGVAVACIDPDGLPATYCKEMKQLAFYGFPPNVSGDTRLLLIISDEWAHDRGAVVRMLEGHFNDPDYI